METPKVVRVALRESAKVNLIAKNGKWLFLAAARSKQIAPMRKTRPLFRDALLQHLHWPFAGNPPAKVRSAKPLVLD